MAAFGEHLNHQPQNVTTAAPWLKILDDSLSRQDQLGELFEMIDCLPALMVVRMASQFKIIQIVPVG